MVHDTEITAAEAAEILGVTAHHVGWYHAKGSLPGRRIGKRLLVFRRADVEGFEKPKKTGRPVKAAKPASKKPTKPANSTLKKQRGKGKAE